MPKIGLIQYSPARHCPFCVELDVSLFSSGAHQATITFWRSVIDERRKTKAQLIEEMASLRERISTLEHLLEGRKIIADPALATDQIAAGESDLAGTPRLLEMAIEQSPIPMAIVTADRKLWSVNPAFATRYGAEDGHDVKPGAELSALSDPLEHYDVDGKFVPTEELPLSRAFRGIASTNVDLRLVRKDGSQVWQNVSAAPVYDDDEKLIAGFLMIPETVNFNQELEQLRKNEERYRILADYAPDSACLLDPDGRIVDANSKACDSLGYTREEFLKLSISDIDLDFPSDKLADLLDRVKDGDRLMVEGTHRRKDGSTFAVEVHLRAFASKAQLLVFALARDISDRKQAELELSQSRADLADAQRIAQTGHWIWNPQNGDLHWSRELLRIFGEEPDFAPSYETFIAAVHPDDKETVETAVADALADIRPYAVDATIILPGGETREIYIKGEVTFTEDRQPVLMRGTATDITERKCVERALLASESSLREAQKIAHLGNWSEDLETGHIDWSDELFAIMGIDRTELNHAVILDCVHPDDRQLIKTTMERNVVRNDPDETVSRIIRPDGSIRHLLHRRQFEQGADGRKPRVFGTTQDITEQILAAEDLRASEKRFRSLFEDVPISLWEEDFSGVLSYLEELHFRDIEDFEEYLVQHPEVTAKCASLVRVVAVNNAGLKLHGAANKGEIVDGFRKMLALSGFKGFIQELLAIWRGDTQFQIESDLKTIAGTTLNVALNWFVPSGHEDTLKRVLVSITDISDRKRGEQALQVANRALSVLSQCDQALVRATEESELLDTTCRILVETGGYRLAWIGFAEHDENQSIRPVAQAGFGDHYLDTIRLTWADDERGMGAAGTAIRTRKTYLARDIHTDPKFEQWRDMALQQGYASAIFIPLRLGKALLGVLNIYSPSTDAFDHEETRLLETLAEDIAYGVVTLKAAEAHRRAENLESEQRAVLELISGGQSSQPEILTAITSIAEKHIPDVRSSILMFDGKAIRYGAAPSMPDEYSESIDGLEIGLEAGPSGTAMYRRERVVVEDIRVDPLWKDIREISENFDFRACWAEPILDPGGRVLGTFTLYRARPGLPNDLEINLIESMAHLTGITIQRDRRETELKKLSAAVEQSPAAVFITDPNGVIEYVNSSFTNLTGYSAEESQGVTPDFLKEENTPTKTLAEIWETVLAGNEWKGELLNQKKNGESYWASGSVSPVFDDNGQVSHILAIQEDITARKALEAENVQLERHLRRSQKLETIGILAGGIAHDFNNILTPIMGYAEMAADMTEASDAQHANLERILGAARRAKELVERILLFSRQTEKEQKPVKIQLIAHEAIQLLRSSIPATISIDEQIDLSCDWVMGDETQIHAVIVNICTNAYQAMDSDSGTMTIGVDQLQVNAETARLHPDLAEEKYVRISIRDTGKGMDSTIVDRVFEPFFTTKTVDKGSGMGLSVAHGIVQSHGGDVLVHSVPGEGTLFEVYLPVTTEEVRIEPDEKNKEVEKGQESILVVDDDPAVADVVTAMVKALGYTVTTHTSSTSALEEITQHPDCYQLVISDLTMPDLSGLDLSAQLSRLDNPIPIMIMTGYGERLEREGQEIPRVIGKPVALKELASAIRELLDSD